MADYEKIRSRLQARCVRREYCTEEIRRKALDLFEGDGEAARRVVASLLEDRFVDDARYARAFARDKAVFTGWGTEKIRLALRAKKIPEEAIQEALDAIDVPSAADKLLRLLRTRDRSLAGDPSRRLKLLRYGVGRGYPYDEVSEAVTALLREGSA